MSKHDIVGYVTDIEGNYDYWNRYVALSKVLKRNTQTKTLELRDDSQLVFGGDVCDRGTGDIRIVRELLSLKRRYPDRVHFILGNRDVNKLRIDIELQVCNLASPGQVYWIDQPSEANQSAIDRLKWILLRTMGAPGAFEYRRKELQEMNLPAEDNDVVRSYVDWLQPDGEMVEFLLNGKVAVIIGDTIFLHGALKPTNIGWVPPRRGEKSGGYCVDKIREWVDHMNSFLYDEVKDYKDNIKAYMDACKKLSKYGSIPYWAQEGGYNHSMPGSRLLQYGMGWMPDKSVNPTAIYACYLNNTSPTFTAKLVTHLTALAQEDKEKRSAAKITFQRASRAAASLRRLQLAVHSNSIVHEPKTARSDDALDTGKDKDKAENATQSLSSLSARSDSAVIDISRKLAVTDAVIEKANAASTNTKVAAKGKESNKPSQSKVSKDKDSGPSLVSPWDRAEDNLVVEEDEATTASTMQTCVNHLVTYVSMLVDGAAYAFYRDPGLVPVTTSDHDVQANEGPVQQSAFDIKPKGATSPAPLVVAPDAATADPSLSESFQRMKEIEAQRERERDLVKVIPAVAPVGGLFAHVKDVSRPDPATSDGHLLASSSSPSKDRLTQAKKTPSSMSVFGQREMENESAEVQMNYYLLTSGIRNVVVGHQPRGDAPLILDSEDGLKVISADTSYAINSQWSATYKTPQVDGTAVHELDLMPPPPADSTRGIAVCEIYLDITCASLPSSSMDITQRPVTPDSLAQAPAPAAAQAAAMNTNVYLQGRLSNGLAYEFEVGAMDPDYVGRKTPSGWYIKASGIIAMEVVDEDKILEPKSYYLLTQFEGFVVRNRLVAEEEIDKEFEPVEVAAGITKTQ